MSELERNRQWRIAHREQINEYARRRYADRRAMGMNHLMAAGHTVQGAEIVRRNSQARYKKLIADQKKWIMLLEKLSQMCLQCRKVIRKITRQF